MTANNKGFTIIEVVITIAIGAAVMALVLNAVAGARRSQRNNARSADINRIAAGYNQYIAARNALPAAYADINDIVGDNLGHYTPAQINNVGSWKSSLPATSAAGVCVANSSATAAEQASQTAATTKLACETPATNPGTWTPPSATGKFEWNDDYATAPASGTNMEGGGNADYLVVINEAACDTGNKLPVSGGIREAVIVYNLEGQSDTICLEI